MNSEKPTRDPTKFTNLEDTSVIAFLKLKGHVTKPWVSYDDPSNPRVSFDIEGDQDQIEKDLQAFYANEQIRILDYVRCFKEIKSALYQMKRIGKKD